jgi:transcriptional regulator with XRE-family HTH domain
MAERLAETLQRLRADAKLSQVQMAKRLRISRSTLNRLESAGQNATLQTLDHLCRVLKCEPGELFTGVRRASSPRKRGRG